MMVSATFCITDKRLPTGSSLEDVTVRVFSEDGATFVTQGTTDSDGELVLDLPDDTTYWIRFFLIGYSFDSKLLIDVDSSESSNEFDVRGANLSTHPPSTSTFLCRASGYLRGADMAPKQGLRVTAMYTYVPRIVGGQAVVQNTIVAQSNEDGWLEIELIQGGIYDFTISGLDDETIRVIVPFSQAVPFTDLVWPAVSKFEYEISSVSVEVGESTDVAAVTTLSSGVVTPVTLDDGSILYARSYIDLEISDEGVASFEWGPEDSLSITGHSVGVSSITASVREGVEAERYPAPSRELATLSITVTG